MIRLALIAVMSLGPPPGDGSVHGTIQSDRYETVAGVRIEIPAESVVAWSDSTGAYQIEGLEPGEYKIRFSQFGYHPLELQVTVPHDGSLSLDVRLRTRFIVFPEISALAYTSLDPGEVFEPNGLPEIGSRVLAGDVLWSDPLARQPDVFEILSIIPGIDMAEESPTQLHVRGGSADQNLVLLDGAPVYNAYHTSGIMSAISPDAVSEVAIHTGVFPARYGGRLSSVIDVSIPEPGEAGLRVRGGAGLADLRMTVDAPMPGAAGGVLIGGRRTRYDLFRRGPFPDENPTSGFDDLLGKVSIDVLGGQFDVVSLTSDNWVFSNVIGDEASVATEEQRALRNSVLWSASTNAVAWSRRSDAASDIRFQLWRATTNSDVHWGASSERYRAVNALKHWGASGDVSWVRPETVGRAGFTVEALSSKYVADPLTSDTALSLADAEAVLDLRSSQKIVSTYFEHRWIARDHWIVNNGLRAVFADGHSVGLEPRVSVHYRPDERVTLSGGYARVHQYVQSLRNGESLLNVAFGAEPLVTADAREVPVGRSDQLTAALEARLSDRLLLTVDGYLRWLDDLVLVAPTTAQPFAITAFERGKGRAIGTGAALFYRGDRVEAEAIVELSTIRRQYGDVTYHPGFERSRSVITAASYRLTPQTKVRTAFQAVAGRSTNLVQEGFDWESFDRLSGEVEFSGTPLRLSDAVNDERLPAYVRWDIGIRKEWNPSLLGLSGSVMTYLDVTNVLEHDNVVGYGVNPSGLERRDLRLLPASTAFGLEWSF
jgi:hypothetical protein